MPDDGYPHDLAGAPAPPPGPVEARVLGMAAKAHARHLGAAAERLYAAGWPTNPRPAAALLTLRDETNAFAPGRSKASDGMIGDARHQDAGSGSDHNGWLKVAGIGVVRAFDITNDPALDLPARFELLRARAAAGDCPQLPGGGYLILNGRITADDWSGWRAYSGADPHVSHGHVSLSRDPARFDDTRAWGLFSSEQPATPAPVPVAPAPAPAGPGWTGPDLTGQGNALRGDQGNNGPRVLALQRFCNRVYPAYSSLAEDGWWGPRTSAVIAEFGHRSGIGSADGLNIGPKLAAALFRAGFERQLSTARQRVRGHLSRATGR